MVIKQDESDMKSVNPDTTRKPCYRRENRAMPL